MDLTFKGKPTRVSFMFRQCVQKHLEVAVVEHGLIEKALVCPFEHCPSKFKMVDLQNLFKEGASSFL